MTLSRRNGRAPSDQPRRATPKSRDLRPHRRGVESGVTLWRGPNARDLMIPWSWEAGPRSEAVLHRAAG